MKTVPLRREQVDAANRLYCESDHLTSWRLSDEALALLRDIDPLFERATACLLKCTAIDRLYGTNYYSVTKNAGAIRKAINENWSSDDLVRQVAAAEGEGGRTRASFASKLCHIFVDEERFPIIDALAEGAMRLHVNGFKPQAKTGRYQGFCGAFRDLQGLVGSTTRELDRYLWITGAAWERANGKSQRNMISEIIDEQLAALQPILPDQVFERLSIAVHC